MKLTTKYAIVLALGTAVISGFSNYIAKIAVTVAKDPVVFTTLKNGIVALLLLGIIVLFRKFKELKNLSRSQWVKLIVIGVIGGSIPFVLFFTGLTTASAMSAGFIHKMLFVWVALFAIPFLKERLSWVQGVALLLLIGGNVAILGTHSLTFGKGEFLVLIATVFWAVENIIAKKTLATVSSTVVAGARMVFGSVILIGIVAVQGNLGLLSNLSATQWLWTIIPSILLFGYVLTWYTALKHAPATLVASMLVPASLITNILSLAFQGSAMTAAQALSAGLWITAIALILWQTKNHDSKSYTSERSHTS